MTSMEKSDKTMVALVVCLDIIILNVLFLAFNTLWDIYRDPIFNGNLIFALLSITVSYAISSFFSGVTLFYRRIRTDQIIVKSVTGMFAFLVTWLLITAPFEAFVFKQAISIYFILATIFITFFRIGYHSYLKSSRAQGRHSCNVIYIGSSSNIRELFDEMSMHLTTGYNIMGYFDNAPNPKFEDKCKYLGRSEKAIEYLSQHSVDRIYCGLASKDSDIIVPIINYSESHLIRFFSVPNFRNYCQRRVTLEMFSNVPLLTIREEPLNIPINRAFKRIFDIAFSALFLCTLFIPIYIIVGIITKITSPGPIFFKQKRHGLDGKEFDIYKFRSMKVNTEADSLQATEDDPRKTKFGDLLRRTSIDELPQFINVFLGNMSVVGPRPHMVKHTEEYSQLIKTYMVRHLIKPGVTGWAQVTGYRGETKDLSDMEGRIKGDIWYMEHWTFTLDLYIIYKTIANIVGKKDKTAY